MENGRLLGLVDEAMLRGLRRLRPASSGSGRFNQEEGWDMKRVQYFFVAAATMKINEEKGNEFLVMAFTSAPRITELGNKLTIVAPGSFVSTAESSAFVALKPGCEATSREIRRALPTKLARFLSRPNPSCFCPELPKKSSAGFEGRNCAGCKRPAEAA